MLVPIGSAVALVVNTKLSWGLRYAIEGDSARGIVGPDESSCIATGSGFINPIRGVRLIRFRTVKAFAFSLTPLSGLSGFAGLVSNSGG